MIKGPHNLENALAAVLLTMLAGVDKESVAYTLKTFTGVEHRIETVMTKDGVTYITIQRAQTLILQLKPLKQ